MLGKQTRMVEKRLLQDWKSYHRVPFALSHILLSAFENEEEANNMKKYMQTQFVRFLLSSILITQNIAKDKFAFVPLQDFTPSSDIDWSQSVADIDRQLYKKYGLTDEETAFIEWTIKPME